MELYYIRGSAYSLRVIWALDFFPDEIKNEIELISVGGANDLEERVLEARDHRGEEIKQVMLPVLFYTEGDEEFVVTDGFEILKFLAERSEERKLESSFLKGFSESSAKIKEINEKTSSIMAFLRLVFASSPDNFVKYLAPRWTGFVPSFQKYLTSTFKQELKKNYGHLLLTVEEAERRMDELEALLTEEYVHGKHLSYSDLILVSLIEMALPVSEDKKKPLLFGALDKSYLKRIHDLNWHKKFPKLWGHREKVLKNHFSEDVREKTELKLRRKMKKSSVLAYN